MFALPMGLIRRIRSLASSHYKVATPHILAWMKETNFLFSARIESMGLCAFVTIAPGTGVAKIF